MTEDGPWRSIANFRIKNPSHPANQPWSAETIPAAKMLNGLEFALGGLTLEAPPLDGRDIWNHIVSLRLRVRTNAVTLTNWSAARVEGEDASSNWGYFEDSGAVTNDWTLYWGWSGLDPRFVWKLDIDFWPISDFAPENLHRFQVPVPLSGPIPTNSAGIPLEISWVNQNMLSVQMLTNRPDLRVSFATAKDREGRNLDNPSGNWNQGGFWRGLKLEGTTEFVEATIAIVPNVHVTYYVQPKLVPLSGQNQSPHGQSP